MTSLFHELIYYDNISFRYWFSKEKLSKIIILILFILVALSISFGLYFFSYGFFKYLLTFETYGQFTTVYILKASLIVILWLGILSSFISTLSFLLTPDKRIDYLFTQPQKPKGIIFYQNYKSLSLNFSIFAILVLPVIIGFLHSSQINLLDAIIRTISILVLITLISESLGSTLGYIISNRFKKKEGFIYVLGAIILVVFLTVAIFKLILPPELKTLYSSSTANFVTIFNQLPLNKFCAVNNNLAFILTNGLSVSGLLLFLFAIFLVIVAFQTQVVLFSETWQQGRVNLENHFQIFKLKPTSLKYPSIFQKDFVSILRSPKEMSYGIFLFSLLLGFIGLFSRGIEINRIPDKFSWSLVVFSWLWLSFYAITYFMRICFPSMSKEGKTRWWLFTLPIRPRSLLHSKIYTSLIFTIPIFIIAIFEWWLIPFQESSLFMSLLSLISIITLMFTITTIGIIRPDYSQSDDPEKVSTGLSGIFALTISLVISGLSALLIYSSLTFKMSELSSIFSSFIFMGVSFSILYSLALNSLKNHTLEVK